MLLISTLWEKLKERESMVRKEDKGKKRAQLKSQGNKNETKWGRSGGNENERKENWNIYRCHFLDI